MYKYVITGGPGSGKTSLLTALADRGYSVSPEASRQLILEEQEKGSSCLPWLDLDCFAEKALERMRVQYQSSAEDKITFFDRGIPDIVAYLRAGGLRVAEKYDTASAECRYHKTVLLLPPWRGIYIQDPARWQTFEEAETIYFHLREIYGLYGYELCELPCSSVQQRIAFIEDTIIKSKKI